MKMMQAPHPDGKRMCTPVVLNGEVREESDLKSTQAYTVT